MTTEQTNELVSGEWWRGAVFYQVYPISFMDTDGDGFGDLAGVTARLDYIAGLGVDAIWLSPVFRSPMLDFGYDVSDYCDIDPMFGTLGDFDDLVASAHQRGLKVIIDQVYSHSAKAHSWFAESRTNRTNPKADWYIWADAKADGTVPNNWLSVFGGPAWQWDSGRQQYYFHNYLREQPDLNLHNSEVQAAILEVARFWLDRGVDGFRLDAVNCYMHDPALRDNPSSGATSVVKPYLMQKHLFDQARPEAKPFLADLRRVIDERSGRVAVAELSSDRPLEAVRDFASGPDGLHSSYTFHLMGKNFRPSAVHDLFAGLEHEAPNAWPTLTLGNHDVERIATRWREDQPQPQWSKLLFALVTSLRGSVFTYQGDELGLPQSNVPRDRLRDPEGIEFWPAYKGRDGSRTPIPWVAAAKNAGFTDGEPWLPIDPSHHTLAVDRQDADPNSMLNFVRSWLRARAGWPAVRVGSQAILSAEGDVLVFERATDGERFLFIFNFGADAAEVSDLPTGAWRPTYDLGGTIQGGRAMLPAASGLVLRDG